MRRILLLTAAISGLLLLMYLAAEWMGLALLADPLAVLQRHEGTAAILSFGLLASDVVLPVPSSILMIANGALFGVWTGAAISTLASVLSAAIGFWIGRRGKRIIAQDGTGTEVNAWLSRWGGLAIAVSRPVPLLAESIAIAAGTTSLGWRTLLASSLVGTLPAAFLYAYAGARSVEPGGAAVIFGCTLALSAILWWLGYRRPLTKAGGSG